MHWGLSFGVQLFMD